MNPKRIFIVMMAMTIAVSFVVLAPAFSQIKELEQTLRSDPYHRFGYSVSGGCDLNSDGRPDLIVGAPYLDLYGMSNAGRVYIFSGANGTAICILDGEASGNLFGFSVSCGGDLNNDGTPDFIVGAPGRSSNTGKVYVYSGGTFSLLHTFSGEATGDKFGFSVSGAGDANADHCDDLIIGAPDADSAGLTNCGKIYLYRGCSWAYHWVDKGEASYDGLGYSVAGGCDVNDDPYDDVIVGAPYVDELLKVDCGRIYVLSGDDPTPALRWKTGENSYDHLGWSVSGVGDFDADSHLDFAAGAPGYNNYAGAVYVYKGTGLCLKLCEHFGAASGDSFGWSVSGAGDVNNDGKADVIIGAPGVDNDRGKVYVYLGDVCNPRCTILGRNQGDRFGFSVSSAGDVAQGDNKDDLLIGAPSEDIAGRAYVHSGEEGCAEIFEFYPVYPYIDISSPIGEENWCIGEVDTIWWTSYFISENVWIDYSTDGGGHWISITSGTLNDGQYEWNIPPPASENCLVRICGVRVCEPDTVCEISNLFSIVEPTIKVTSPNGGERWCVDDSVCVAWYSSCVPGGVKIQLSTHSGSTWDTVLAANTPNDGEYCFNCPNLPSEHCRIRICDALNGVICDVSDGDFAVDTITILRVLSPNGGEEWCAGYPHPITWLPSCLIDTVNIQYGGYYWYSVALNTPNDGEHTWNVPSAFPGYHKLRICDVNFSYCDTSDNYFKIVTDCYPAEPETLRLSGAGYDRGDVNGDKMVNQGDIVCLINYLYIKGPPPVPLAAGDSNCDRVVNSADIVYLINYLFIDGLPPCDQ